MNPALSDNDDAALVSSTNTRDIGDLRFRALLSGSAWASLPQSVRKRFSKRLCDGASAVYAGRVTAIEISNPGRILAQCLRLIGAPLPLSCKPGAASVVTVTEDAASGGQNWTRLFARKPGFPQIIHSVKRFSGPTGLEEYVGFGISMALTSSVEDGTLVFRSSRYCLAFRNWRIPLPRWICPGDLTVAHKEVTPTSFLFTLHLEHKVFGRLVHQEALYDEASL